MSLFTGKGDDGTTSKFGCDQRFAKSADLAEALGTVDEINSFLGIIKVKSDEHRELIGDIQQNLFIVQAELAGADQTIDMSKVDVMSEKINEIEKELPPINSFLVSGGCELSSYFDYSRTLARRAERRVVKVMEDKDIKVGKGTLAYLNRLSSMLYALARLSNHKFGINEEPPRYE